MEQRYIGEKGTGRKGRQRGGGGGDRRGKINRKMGWYRYIFPPPSHFHSPFKLLPPNKSISILEWQFSLALKLFDKENVARMFGLIILIDFNRAFK
jgi:hypothetical protein